MWHVKNINADQNNLYVLVELLRAININMQGSKHQAELLQMKFSLLDEGYNSCKAWIWPILQYASSSQKSLDKLRLYVLIIKALPNAAKSLLMQDIDREYKRYWCQFGISKDFAAWFENAFGQPFMVSAGRQLKLQVS